ncbi:MAG: hypothetical protein BGN87_20795 [Rhizobiales bacterium 65-79]|nr:MAG: hypothetical protein BGN87_20795 [Rhizobiales bacterium 65-79]
MAAGLGPVDGLETDFAMRVAPDLIDKAMALRVAAGAVGLARKVPCPYSRYDLRGFPRHLSARASHEIHPESVHRA